MERSRSWPLPRLRAGLHAATDAAAQRVEGRWRVPLALSLIATVPAFYAELLEEAPPIAATLAYAAAALVVALALAHTALRHAHPRRHLARNPADLLLVAGLLTAAALPPSRLSTASLVLRSAVSLLVLLRLVWTLRPLLARGGLSYLLSLALGTLGLCGAGFWWLEPTVHSFGDGLWLAFTTAATVGYGDLVPTTAAAKIFSVFVVLLGFAVLSTVTAAIAANWIETEERHIEREILHDLRRQIGTLHAEIAALRDALATTPGDAPAAPADRRRSASPPSRSEGP